MKGKFISVDRKIEKRIKGLICKNEVLRNYHQIIFSDKSETKPRFLDLSCGTRTDVREIVESFCYDWVGVDIIDAPSVIKSDAHHLPFRDAEFDIVYSAAAFEHYYDPWQVAHEVKRILKPRGISLKQV